MLPLEQSLNLFLAQIETSNLLESLLVMVHLVVVACLIHGIRLPLHLLQQLTQRFFILFAIIFTNFKNYEVKR